MTTPNVSENLKRREMLRVTALVTAAVSIPSMTASGVVHAAAPAKSDAKAPRLLPAQHTWDPVPPQAPAKEGFVQVPGAKLWYWDTGGSGEAIVLLHPHTGSALVWGYQQPVFAKAGYRVISFSRRGHVRSIVESATEVGAAADDIAAVVDHLKIDRFHLVGTALGGMIAPDFALSYPQRLLSLTLACSICGVTEPSHLESFRILSPPAFRALPASFRELGPSYRMGNRAGVAEWEALEHAAHAGPTLPRQAVKNRLHYEDIARIKTPVLIMPASSDLYAPPALMLQVASHLENVETVILSESGHSGYWEQPNNFNAAILDFVGRHRMRKA
jgi:pimeloyl-ACP methyl ester carboxylesterase